MEGVTAWHRSSIIWRRTHLPLPSVSTSTPFPYLKSSAFRVLQASYRVQMCSGRWGSGGGTHAGYGRVQMDRAVGLSRGFAYVEFHTAEEAEAARTSLDGGQLDGNVIT